MNDVPAIEQFLQGRAERLAEFSEALLVLMPPQLSADGIGIGTEIWNTINHVHHLHGQAPGFVENVFNGAVEYLKAAHHVLAARSYENAFLILYEPLSGSPNALSVHPIVLYWSRDLGQEVTLTIRGVQDDDIYLQERIKSSCFPITLPDHDATVALDGDEAQRFAPVPDGTALVPFLEGFVPAFAHNLIAPFQVVEGMREHGYCLADPGFFVRTIDGIERNIVWERFLHLNAIRGVQYVTARDVPFEVVCGYIHSRSRNPGIPLVATPALTDLLRSAPFSFEYFEGNMLSVFMLADYAADFSRLASTRDPEQMLLDGALTLESFLNENTRFAQSAMGDMYSRLCELDPHQRDGLMLSNFLAASFKRNFTASWIDAPIDEVASLVGTLCGQLCAYQGHLGVIPDCWFPHIRRGFEQVDRLQLLAIPAFDSDERVRERIARAFVTVRQAYEKAMSGRSGGKVPFHDLGLPCSSVNVIALAGGSGLSENGRMLWRIVRRAFSSRLFEVDFQRRKTRGASSPGGRRTREGRSINIFALNGDHITDAATLNPMVCRREAFNIGFLLWETSRPPEPYLNGLALLDEVWVPSSYLADVFKKLVPDSVEVVNVGKHIDVVHDATFGLRERFEIPDSAHTFLTIADFGSSLSRKNLAGAVDAFQAANLPANEARLIIKIRRIDRQHWSNHGGLWESIERKIRNDERVHIVEGNLSSMEYWGLLNDADCMISLHRSEGFGYGIAHCHGLGKKTIVSDYSGVRDFCKPHTAHLVPCEEVLVNPVDMNCREPIGVWGEPDIGVAAQAIRTVAAEPRGPSEMGAAAKALFEELYAGDRFRTAVEARIARAIELPAQQD